MYSRALSLVTVGCLANDAAQRNDLAERVALSVLECGLAWGRRLTSYAFFAGTYKEKLCIPCWSLAVEFSANQGRQAGLLEASGLHVCQNLFLRRLLTGGCLHNIRLAFGKPLAFGGRA